MLYRKIVLCMGLICLITGGIVSSPNAAMAEERVALLEPVKTGGMPLMEALTLRQSERDISDQEISKQDLSNLLWATFGINRDDGRRTAPTARNKQKIQVYAVMPTGVWLYDAKENQLVKAIDGDFTSDYNSPLTLLYAAPDDQFGGMHAGSLYQNAALYCASAGLANVVKINGIDDLEGKLKLPSDYKVLVLQLIGIPE